MIFSLDAGTLFQSKLFKMGVIISANNEDPHLDQPVASCITTFLTLNFFETNFNCAYETRRKLCCKKS